MDRVLDIFPGRKEMTGLIIVIIEIEGRGGEGRGLLCLVSCYLLTSLLTWTGMITF